MENIDAFEYSKLKLINENPSKVISWITILIVTLVLFLIFSIFLKYNIYKNYIGYIDINDNYNLKIYVDQSSFPLNKKDKLYINNKKYKYKIIKINLLDNYYEILIDCKLDKNLLINNNIINLRFKKGSTTLITEIINKLKEELM